MCWEQLCVHVYGVCGGQRLILGVADFVCSVVYSYFVGIFPGFEFPRDRKYMYVQSIHLCLLVGDLRAFAFKTASEKDLLSFFILLFAVLVHWLIGSFFFSYNVGDCWFAVLLMTGFSILYLTLS